MAVVNMIEAKSDLSRLVEAVESGAEREIIIARNGKAVARLVPIDAMHDTSKRIGLLKGKYVAPRDFDADTDEIVRMLNGE
ncbi:prevent-host-death family protein [Stella humosa]|uniref:Antitoxin n=1 Tax=Stella humosa TaxID=94 RepID=A0A3N1M2B3_9PROT|nr:type II toxin-antitoxin system prevent-host-death family antitoxin [Stella humosa]ROP99861.1 prevent-host-death family protein [Stella humosa]BBK30910.1 hypothetical protein STHU_15440 [Stella humosa]